jgi:excisionase family DNA binding protein
MSGDIPVSSTHKAKETAAACEQLRFYNAGEIAGMFRVSRMTIYRAINDGAIPAIRVRDRWVVPALAVEGMVQAAIDRVQALTAARAAGEVDSTNRPRPGANQSGAGSFSTQHTAGYGEDATSANHSAGSGGAR